MKKSKLEKLTAGTSNIKCLSLSAAEQEALDDHYKCYYDENHECHKHVMSFDDFMKMVKTRNITEIFKLCENIKRNRSSVVVQFTQDSSGDIFFTAQEHSGIIHTVETTELGIVTTLFDIANDKVSFITRPVSEDAEQQILAIQKELALNAEVLP